MRIMISQPIIPGFGVLVPSRECFVFEFDGDSYIGCSDDAILRHLFVRFNGEEEFAEDDPVYQEYVKKGMRSLSVGDYVTFEPDAQLRQYRCERRGWTAL